MKREQSKSKSIIGIAKGTKIITTSKYKTNSKVEKIEDLIDTEGFVFTSDLDSKQYPVYSVSSFKNVKCSSESSKVIEIKYGDLETYYINTLRCLEDQEILVINNGEPIFVKAKNLKSNDCLLSPLISDDNLNIHHNYVVIEVNELEKLEPVYSIIVNDTHNLFANDICIKS